MLSVDSYISGEKIQQLCDIYCGSEYDLNRNPKIAVEKRKHHNLDELTSQWDNPKIIFCYSSALSIFKTKLCFITNPCILVSHNEDNNITDTYLEIANHHMIIRWFAQNIMIDHPKLQLLPIGIANTMWPHGNIENFYNIYRLQLKKENSVYFYFNIWTNPAQREYCKQVLERKGLHFGAEKTHTNYLTELAKCKFAISPPGNGIDCHRIWECYYNDVIPIVLRSPFTELLASYLPCIVLGKWEDFDYTTILSQYDILLSTLHKNSKFINFNYYKMLIKLSSDTIITRNDLSKYNSFRSFSLTDSKMNPIDFKLDNIFKKEKGFYIELGGNDGLTQSNTAFFEFFKGWKGVIIEPSKMAFDKCVQNRPNSICFNNACISNDFESSEIVGDFNGNLMSSVNGDRLHSNNIVSVQAITLERLLDQLVYSSIDLLSLDTEGYELNILKGLNLRKYRPTFILVEIYNKDYKDICQLLQDNNYSLICNLSNYNNFDNQYWDGTHNDYLFKNDYI